MEKKTKVRIKGGDWMIDEKYPHLLGKKGAILYTSSAYQDPDMYLILLEPYEELETCFLFEKNFDVL